MPTLVEYVWIGGPQDEISGQKSSYVKPYTLRSKERVIYTDTELKLEDIPIWNYDGSSTSQATTKKSEIFIVPIRLFKNPFVKGLIVLCDTYVDYECTIPHDTNTRIKAKQYFDAKLDEEPWFGIELEFFLMKLETNQPAGFSDIPQGQFYCSAGSRNAFGRDVINSIRDYALEAEIKLSGLNAEVAPGQWEFQVGPLCGIEAGDHVWMLRYIMERATEGTPYYIELHPKPLLKENFNGSGAHINYSTKTMREKGGLQIIMNAIEKLSKKHPEHIAEYGEFNELRLCGKCETSSIDKFTYGVSDRSASIRIPTETHTKGYGYFEDRRPSSIMDPYRATSILFATTCLD